MSQAPGGDQQQAHVNVIIPTLSVCSGRDCMLKVLVNGVSANILVDTGAAVTVLSKGMWDRSKGPGAHLQSTAERKLVGVQGTPLQLHGTARVQLELSPDKFWVEVIVADTPTADMILGRDFLRDQKCTIRMGTSSDSLHVQAQGKSISTAQSQAPPTQTPTQAPLNVVLQQSVTVPPRSEMEVMGHTPDQAVRKPWIMQGRESQRCPVMVARALVEPEGNSVPVRLLNPRDVEVSVTRGTILGELESIPRSCTVSTVSSEPERERESELTEEHRRRLWEMVEGAEQSLSEDEKAQLFALLLEYHMLFARGDDDLGCTAEVQHRIDTGNAPPVRQSVRRMPQLRRQEAKNLLDDMLDRSVIQPSSSPWASPVVLVPKKDGSFRFCIDYRRVNAVTRKDAYPLPRVDDTLDTLAGSKWFSTLDLLSGYWQVEVSPEDREKTAFCTHEGLFEFRVMPFGLCNAPATFQRLMDTVLAGLQWSSCVVYLDDTVIPGTTFQAHVANLRAVFGRLKGANLKLKPRKCRFCVREVNFLGHIVSADGVRTDPIKTEKVSTWPQPTSRRELQQFLGLAGYYRRFVPNFAAVAKPLYQLTEKNAKFAWDDRADEAFKDLRQRLVTAPTLAFPDYSRPFILDTDASDVGIGGVLSQKQEDGSERVIAYGSRTLSRPERRYCVTRRELLAVVTFVQHFRPYLLGREFLLRTDHGSLTWLTNFKEPEGQLARWLECLEEYTFETVHRPGKQHANADALSRRPCPQCGREEFQPVQEHAVEAGVLAVLSERSPQELRQLQLEDSTTGVVLQAMEQKQQPEPDVIARGGPEVRRLVQLWNRLLIEDGLLKRKYDSEKGQRHWIQLVVPHVLREEIMKELHAGSLEGHLGEDKTLGKIQERFYWPGMQGDVAQWIRTCSACTTRKSPPQRSRAPLQTVASGFPMQVVAVDILGPLPESTAGNSYILVAGDYFTKWVEAYAIPNQEAVTVARKLVDQMFCRFSPPEQLHSDQGKQFESKLLKEVCNLLGIRKSRTTPYHPQCDGQVERSNRTLLDMLATTTDKHPFDWEDQLPKVCMAYNTSVHASTGYTPFILMFGRQARLPIDLVYGTSTEETSVSEYASSTKRCLEEAYQLVREKLSAAHLLQKAHYDRKVHGKPFAPGDLVWLFSPEVPRGQSKKLHHPWSGPHRVITKLGDSDYRVKKLTGRKKTQVVHFNRLKRCDPETRFDGCSPNHPGTPDNPPSGPDIFGQDMEPLDSDPDDVPVAPPPAPPPTAPAPAIPPTPRYPARHHHRPDWYGDYVDH